MSVETHVHISIDPKPIIEAVTAQLGEQKVQAEPYVPQGYHCMYCFANDGSHNAGCQYSIRPVG